MLIALLSAMAFAQKDINLRHLNEGTEPIYVKGDEWASYFTFSSAEGIELRFSVISGQDMSCRLVSVPKGTKGRVTVPAMAGEYVVREVGDSAFLGLDEVTSVVLPDSISSVGRHGLHALAERQPAGEAQPRR